MKKKKNKMSSHHIVREKQEPALLIANGERCSTETIGTLLEWSPFVHVLDGALEDVLALNIKIDLLSGDFDSISSDLEDIRKIQFPIEIINTPDQNKTDLEKGLEILIEKGFPAVNVLWATGKRADHFYSNFHTLAKFASLIKITFIDDYGLIFPLLPLPNIYKKWHTANSIISLMPFPIASGVNSHNLLFELNNEALSISEKIGTSNAVAKNGVVEISLQSGVLLIMEAKS
jgi:thiamine pyrophosphokinase